MDRGALAQRQRKQSMLILINMLFENTSTEASNCAPKSKQKPPHTFQLHLEFNSVLFECSQTCMSIESTSSDAPNLAPNSEPNPNTCVLQFTSVHSCFILRQRGRCTFDRFRLAKWIRLRPIRFRPIRRGPIRLSPTGPVLKPTTKFNSVLCHRPC